MLMELYLTDDRHTKKWSISLFFNQVGEFCTI